MAKPKIASFKPKQVTAESPKIIAKPINNEDTDLKTKLDEHIANKEIHVTKDDHDAITYLRKDVDSHLNKSDVHITNNERIKWNNKETPSGAQSKANKVLNSLNLHKEDYNLHTSKAEKDSFKDKYTKAETRNLLKHTLTGLVFLPAVNNTYELNTKYPDPKFNSCVFIRIEKRTVIFNGETWVDFNGLLTPEVTEENDGLMTGEDKVKLDSIEYGANSYIHPDNIDTRHVSDNQIDYWNNKADKNLVTDVEDGLMGFNDKVKLDSVEQGANNYKHPEFHEPSIIKEDKNHRFVSDEEKAKWDSKVEVKYVDDSMNKTLSASKAFTDTKIASMMNSSESQLQVLRSLAFELKRDDVVKEFFDLYNECVKNKEYQEHALNSNIHISKTDRILMNDIKSALDSGLNPDWNETNASSISYIENKPTSLPANGGNADTVGGYTAEQLLDTTCFYDFDIHSIELLEEVVAKLNKNELHNVLIRPGSYELDKELVIRVSNSTITGIGEISKLLKTNIKIIGNNNVIENITFNNIDTGYVNKVAIYVEGNNNTIRYNKVMNYNDGIIVEGSNNKVYHNTLVNIRGNVIKLSTDNNANYGNTVNDNEIKNSNIGIVLLSSKNTLTKNIVTKNKVLNCNVGITLSNTISDITKTTMNIISENIVMRGRGEESEYLPNNKTIISEFSSKNIISSNITSGKEIVAPNDVLSNNIF